MAKYYRGWGIFCGILAIGLFVSLLIYSSYDHPYYQTWGTKGATVEFAFDGHGHMLVTEVRERAPHEKGFGKLRRALSEDEVRSILVRLAARTLIGENSPVFEGVATHEVDGTPYRMEYGFDYVRPAAYTEGRGSNSKVRPLSEEESTRLFWKMFYERREDEERSPMFVFGFFIFALLVTATLLMLAADLTEVREASASRSR